MKKFIKNIFSKKQSLEEKEAEIEKRQKEFMNESLEDEFVLKPKAIDIPKEIKPVREIEHKIIELPTNFADLNQYILNAVDRNLLLIKSKNIEFKSLTLHLERGQGDLLTYLVETTVSDVLLLESISALIKNIGHKVNGNFKLKTVIESKNFNEFSKVCNGLSIELIDVKTWNSKFTFRITALGGQMEKESYILDHKRDTKIFLVRGLENKKDGKILKNDLVFVDPFTLENPSEEVAKNQKVSGALLYFQKNKDTNAFEVGRRKLGYNDGIRVAIYRGIKENLETKIRLNELNIVQEIQDGDQISIADGISISIEKIYIESEIKTIRLVQSNENDRLNTGVISTINAELIADKLSMLRETNIGIHKITLHFKDSKNDVSKELIQSGLLHSEFFDDLKKKLKAFDIMFNANIEIPMLFNSDKFTNFSVLVEGVSLEIVEFKDLNHNKRLRITTSGGVLENAENIIEPNGKLYFIGRERSFYTEGRFLSNDIYYKKSNKNPNDELLKNNSVSRSLLFIQYNKDLKKYQVGRRKIGFNTNNTVKLFKPINEDDSSTIRLKDKEFIATLDEENYIFLTKDITLNIELIN